MEYKIVAMKLKGLFGTDREATSVQFAEEVNRHIALGWEPQGGVVFEANSQGIYQAMVKRR
jgi:hypothetical protein